MENEAGNDDTDASVAMTALKAVVALVFIGGMTFALVVGYAHFDDGSETPQFEEVEGYEFRQEVVNNWENPGPNNTKYDRGEIEQLVFEYTNEERAAEGLEELEYTDEFVEVARGHSADMANNGYVGHVDSQNRRFGERVDFRNDGMDAEVCLPLEEIEGVEDPERLRELQERLQDTNISTGENAGATFYETEVQDERRGETVTPENEEEIAQTLMNDWMTSPPHRENILKEDFDALSVGVYVSDGKTVFATQVFCGSEIEIG